MWIARLLAVIWLFLSAWLFYQAYEQSWKIVKEMPKEDEFWYAVGLSALSIAILIYL